VASVPQPCDSIVGVRLATIRTGDGTHAARVEGDVLVELEYPDVGALLRSGPDALDRLGGATTTHVTGAEHAVGDADYAPVIVDPGKIVCVGVNYADHIAEMGREPPEFPTLFAKFSDALIGARDTIVLPTVSDMVDWEVELAVVVGRTVRHASAADAAAAIAGFTIANDVSMRDWQNRTLEWLQGKTFEHATPVGPWLVTPDEVGGTAPDLELVCDVDGIVRQRSRTSQLVFGPAAIVAYLSDVVTLRPGDLVLTGTPGGVGHAMDPPVYLRAGQVVRTEIEGIGELVNPCVPEMP
jgi:acylpyruvate hydrolase